MAPGSPSRTQSFLPSVLQRPLARSSRSSDVQRASDQSLQSFASQLPSQKTTICAPAPLLRAAARLSDAQRDSNCLLLSSPSKKQQSTPAAPSSRAATQAQAIPPLFDLPSIPMSHSGPPSMPSFGFAPLGQAPTSFSSSTDFSQGTGNNWINNLSYGQHHSGYHHNPDNYHPYDNRYQSEQMLYGTAPNSQQFGHHHQDFLQPFLSVGQNQPQIAIAPLCHPQVQPAISQGPPRPLPLQGPPIPTPVPQMNPAPQFQPAILQGPPRQLQGPPIPAPEPAPCPLPGACYCGSCIDHKWLVRSASISSNFRPRTLTRWDGHDPWGLGEHINYHDLNNSDDPNRSSSSTTCK
ncbi:hypothetical protein PCANC_24000 [Puccinia coronata f. sp. avenae]|uniref:Uncharacterized protein n=1 Tax=Puccinia coronata f. sp. avenae TaxID=200324 RepID=A0A2N5TSA6_9BASI|nr:hypothetical protein PCANC_24000 [Puccinia coronata f. sp. avenae]